jgi:hypothetical protein
MADPIWYLGPDYDLQPLVCPEPDFDVTPVRYGGVFQGLSGARSVTHTGVRMQWTMELDFLDPDEYLRLEALLYRRIPGPYRLISPFKTNMMSPDGSMFKPTFGIDTGLTGMAIYQGSLRQVRDWPAAAGVSGGLSTGWLMATTSGNYARMDQQHRLPVKAGEVITGSVYIKCATAGTMVLGFDWFDKNGVQLSGTPSTTMTLTSSWVRWSVVSTPPANAVTARMFLINPSSGLLGAEVFVAAGQAEKGGVATAWGPGGGAPRVIVDQLPTKTPRFPYKSATLVLLEA